MTRRPHLACAAIAVLALVGCSSGGEEGPPAGCDATDDVATAFATLEDEVAASGGGFGAAYAVMDQSYDVERTVDDALLEATADDLVSALERVSRRVQELRATAGDYDPALVSTVNALDLALTETGVAIDEAVAICR